MSCQMNTDIKTIKAMADFMLWVELVDGRSGLFDLKPHLARPGLSALKQPDYFDKVDLLFGAATWPGGEDIAPNTLAAELRVEASA